MTDPTKLGDILLGTADVAWDGNPDTDTNVLWPFMLTPGGYSFAESFRTRPNPVSEPRTLSPWEHQNSWTYFGQDEWLGMGFARWSTKGFKDACGVVLNEDGVEVAKQLEKVTGANAPTANSEGYVMFTVQFGPEWITVRDRIVVIGKSNGYAWSIAVDPGGNIVALQNYGFLFNGVPNPCTGSVFYNRSWWVGDGDGHIWNMNFVAAGPTAGAIDTPTDFGSYSSDNGGTETNGHHTTIIGVLGHKLYVGMLETGITPALNTNIYEFDSDLAVGPRWKRQETDCDQPSVTGAAGGGALYAITRGDHSRVFQLTRESGETSIRQIGVIGTSFQPKQAIFLDRLFIAGGEYSDQLDGSTPGGVVWQMEAGGFSEIFRYRRKSAAGQLFNQSIQQIAQVGERVLWCASETGFEGGRSGFGVFDPGLEDTGTGRGRVDGLGWYMSGTIPELDNDVTGIVVDGICEDRGIVFVGVRNEGVFYQTTPGPFAIEGGVFGADQRNINKLWGGGEIRHTALAGAQFVTLHTRKDPEDTILTWVPVATEEGGKLDRFDAPALDYRTAYLTYIIRGDGADLPMTLFDVAIGYIRMTDPTHVKREWTLHIDVTGMIDPKTGISTRMFRDQTNDPRIWSDLASFLRGLWNKQVVFQDIDGAMFDGVENKRVIVKAPLATAAADRPTMFHPGELDRLVEGTEVTNLSLPYTIHLVET